MRCTGFLQELGEFLDGDTNAVSLSDCRQHLVACHKCRILVETCRQTIAIFRSQPAGLVRDDLHGKVMAALTRQRRQTPPPSTSA